MSNRVGGGEESAKSTRSSINSMSSRNEMMNTDKDVGAPDRPDVYEPPRAVGKSSASANPDLSCNNPVKKSKLVEAEEGKEVEAKTMDEDVKKEEEVFDDGESSQSSGSGADYNMYSSSDRDVNYVSSSDEESHLHYEVLAPANIVSEMNDCIIKANSIIQLPTTIMRVLLNYCGWDQQKLCEALYAGGDAERQELFQAAGVGDLELQTCALEDKASNVDLLNTSGNEEECEVCVENRPSSEMFALNCGHRFCTDCWSHYLKSQIMDEGTGQTIVCMTSKCNIILDDKTVMNMTPDPKVQLKYQQLITNTFVQCNRMIKWCPFPACVYAVKVDAISTQTQSVTCKCGHMFCFKCAENSHDPIQCDMRKKWTKKCADDSETSNWIVAHTKECPKCKVNIQKDGGCNHMFCRNVACGVEFCWVCLGPWKNHDSHKCNRYSANESKEHKGRKQSSCRDALDRYLFYFNRYANHLNSLKLEKDLAESVNSKMYEMQHSNAMSWVEVQFLKQAVDVLCRCRKILMYSYVFAYYVNKTEKNNQIQIFEVNQEDLQASTEKLSGFLERDVQPSSDDLNEMKQKAQDLFRYCEVRCQVLLDHVDEGYKKDWWEFNP